MTGVPNVSIHTSDDASCVGSTWRRIKNCVFHRAESEYDNMNGITVKEIMSSKDITHGA